MMITILAVALLGQAQALGQMTYIGTPNTPESMLILQQDKRLDPPKIGPKDKLQYEYTVSALGSSLPDSPGLHPLRFRVFSQVRKAQNDPAAQVARLSLRLWKYVFDRLKLDHSKVYNNQVVDIYLSWGGVAGGEQLFTEDIENDRPRKVNVIYVYDIASFTDPVEMTREITHEYGHAILPPVGGFKAPEDWGNGQLGEKLFMRWLRDDLKGARLAPIDVMGASVSGIDGWVKKNVDPLIQSVAINGPNFAALAGEGQPAMDAYAGLALYADQVLPRSVFARSLRLTGSTKAADYEKAVVEAVAQAGSVTLALAPAWKDKDIWAPLGKGKIIGASVIKRTGDWAYLRVLNPSGVIITTPIGQ